MRRVKAAIGDVQVNVELKASQGRFSLQVSPKITRPVTSDALLQAAAVGTKVTVEHERVLGTRSQNQLASIRIQRRSEASRIFMA